MKRFSKGAFQFLGVIAVVGCLAGYFGDAKAQNVNSAGQPRFFTSQFTVTTTAQKVADIRQLRGAISLQNLGTTLVACGPSNAVTTSNGFPIQGVAGTTLTIHTTAEVWCIVGTGTQAIAILETSP